MTLVVISMIIQRPHYLQKLIDCRHNGMIKVVTGIRRCGKSFLLFTLFSDWLKQQGISAQHIIQIDLEDRRNKALRNPDALLNFIDSKIKDESMHYVMIDEVQLVPEFEDVLNSYLKIPNVDVYATGSNARFLSKDVITTFRGRSFEIKVYPLSFREFFSVYQGNEKEAFDEFMTFGGMPQILSFENAELKSEYLKSLYTETYLRDIKDRYQIKNDEDMDNLLDFISSSIGSLTNPSKLANTFETVKKEKISRNTVCSYLEYICESFLAEKASRYDVKGKKYLDTPYKFYFTDLGLRNARLNFRQLEPSHMMENIIYNELRIRGFNVDVGVVPIVRRNIDGRQERVRLEIDFVCNKGSQKYYIQSAYQMLDESKIKQEEASLRNVDDSFKKIIVVADNIIVRRNEAGITTMGIYDFLLKANSLEL
ncbi:ATP-binding protein [Bacteroides caecimuris]|uniref:ATP-binding protein n=1 Tax=Bacteroides caecimuris TaxID=1796613 RepID=UPI002430E6FD|nr:ATP-binding protein [Bacteroides caecimuris]